MNTSSRFGAILPRHLSARAGLIIAAYGCNALVVLTVVLVLRGAVSPALMRQVLGVYFIATLAAGLEPATVKAAVLRAGQGEAVDSFAVLAVDALKAMVAAPFLALVWRYADPGAPMAVILCLPLVAFAGFAATDLRVVYDVQGRHAAALWLKQGSLAGGLAVLAGLVMAGVSLSAAVAMASGCRIVLVLMVAARRPRLASDAPRWRQCQTLLSDPTWGLLAGASVVAALGGSVDRLFALRYFSPVVYGGYFLLYELFTRFSLIPYLLSPVIFARRAAGQETDELIRGAWLAVLTAGAGFLIVTAGVVAFAPALVDRFLGAHLGWPILAFAVAVVINALTQLRITELQACGRTRWAAAIVTAGAVVAAVAYAILAQRLGVTGLLWGWLIKSAIEFSLSLAGGRPELAR